MAEKTNAFDCPAYPYRSMICCTASAAVSIRVVIAMKDGLWKTATRVGESIVMRMVAATAVAGGGDTVMDQEYIGIKMVLFFAAGGFWAVLSGKE